MFVHGIFTLLVILLVAATSSVASQRCSVTGNGINVRTGTNCARVVGTLSRQAQVSVTGREKICTIGSTRYTFAEFTTAASSEKKWIAKQFLSCSSSSVSSQSNAPKPYVAPSTSSEGYTCDVESVLGKRVHEGSRYDCRDSRGGNTCKGGQCVALVKCRCTSSDGKYMPATSSWAPGAKVINNGECNTNIPPYTAVATFTNNRYGYPDKAYGHAAVFVKCKDNNAIVIDQYCSKAVNYSTVSNYRDSYYVITNSGTSPDVADKYCPAPESSGSSSCSA